MKKIKTIVIIAVLVNLLSVTLAFAQTEELTLRLSRDFGYGGLNNDIQGLFSVKVTGPTDLVRVVFYVDSNSIGEVTKAPFNLQFNTDNYPLGQHNLYAIGFSSSGKEYYSNKIISNFVPASEGTKVVIPILVIVFGAILVSFIIPLVMGRGKIQNLPLGAERKYNFGGAICPKYQRPFGVTLFSMNLGLSKFTRCPYCGKWGAVHIQTLAKLREAEQAELEWGRGDVQEEAEEEKLRKELDDSKYQGL